MGGVRTQRRVLPVRPRAVRDHGRRNVWLRPLDRFGLGFDS